MFRFAPPFFFRRSRLQSSSSANAWKIGGGNEVVIGGIEVVIGGIEAVIGGIEVVIGQKIPTDLRAQHKLLSKDRPTDRQKKTPSFVRWN